MSYALRFQPSENANGFFILCLETVALKQISDNCNPYKQSKFQGNFYWQHIRSLETGYLSKSNDS